MAQPTAYSSAHVPLVVFGERVVDPGVFEFDPDLTVEEVHEASSGVPTRAAGRIFTGEVKSAIPGDPPIRERLTRTEIEQRYPPDRRMAVGVDHANPLLRTYLVLGYFSKVGARFGAVPRHAFWDETWQLESLLGREATLPERTIQGQWRPSRALVEQMGPFWWNMTSGGQISPGPVETPLTLVQSARCCFNPGGAGNRLRKPVALTYPGIVGEGDLPVKIYLFDDPGSPRAERWTYHQALQYLWFMFMRDALVRSRFLFLTSSPINLGIGGVPTFRLEPSDVPTTSPGWLSSMVRYCETFTPEGRTMLEALVLLHELCGMRFRETIDERPVIDLTFWCPGDTVVTDLLEMELDGELLGPGDVPRDVETDILRRNNVTAASLQRDWTGTHNRLRVVGDRQYFTLRMELSPLWLPELALWDDVATEDVEDLLDEAHGQDDWSLDETSVFYDQHHPGGEFFRQGENSIIGRLYGADFGAELKPADYNRSYEPYKHYGLIDWGALGNWDGDGAPVDLTVRRRVLLPLEILDGSGRTVGVTLEVSWNSGTDWYRVGANEFTTVPDRGAILLTAANLLQFGRDVLETIAADTEQAPPVRNYYEAYLRRTFRLRVTALVDLDARLVSDVRDPWTAFGWPGPLGGLVSGRLVLRTGDFRRVNSQKFLSHAYVGQGDIDDQAAADRCAAGLLDPALKPRVAAGPIMPWLDLPARYPLGTPIAGLRRSMTVTDNDWPFGVWMGPNDLCPEVVGRILRQGLEGASTELVIEQYTYAPAYGGAGY